MDFPRKLVKSHKILRLISLCFGIKMTFLTKEEDISTYIEIHYILTMINVILEYNNFGSKE